MHYYYSWFGYKLVAKLVTKLVANIGKKFKSSEI